MKALGDLRGRGPACGGRHRHPVDRERVRGSRGRQIEVATSRIHDLVRAVKGFTFMDRQGVPDEVDVARGLADTLTPC